MKKLIVFISMTMLLSFSGMAQNDYATVNGKIENKKADEIFIISKDLKSFTKTFTVSSDGKFADTLKVKEGTYFFFDGKAIASIYLKPGNKITANVDSNDFNNTITFIGDGGEISNYETAKGKLNKAFGSNYSLNEDDFKLKSKEFNSEALKMLASANTIPLDFKNKEAKNLRYEYLNRFNSYLQSQIFTTKNPDFKVSDGFFDELRTLTYDKEDDFTLFTAYKELVTAHYNRKAKVLSEKAGIPQDLALIEVFDKIPNETIKNTLLYDNTLQGLNKTDDLSEYYDAFMKVSTNKENNKAISESYKSLKLIDKGQVAPKFVNYENHAGGTTSLEDLKGKYVYIDVWATWCGPCKAEIPYLQQVEKDFHSKNIAFVSISIDETKEYEAWKNMVTEKELGGIQLLADKSAKSKFIQDFLITSIPRFIIIDPSGNIISANAPRPSDVKLIELFNNLKI